MVRQVFFYNFIGSISRSVADNNPFKRRARLVYHGANGELYVIRLIAGGGD
jgi:hypothetical protein